MVVINPTLIFGIHLNDAFDQVYDGNNILIQICNGALPKDVDLGFSVVDVRDVAAANIFLIANHTKESGTSCVCILSMLCEYFFHFI